jgi:hypothetical protein
MLFPSHLNLLANSCYHQFDSFSKLPFIMSQPSVSQCTEGSPYKRVRVDKKQFIGPSYIRMQPISFAIPLSKLRCDFINPDDETSVARGARTIMDTLYGTVSKKGLAMQSRRNSSWGKMGGAVSSPLPVFILSVFVSSSPSHAAVVPCDVSFWIAFFSAFLIQALFVLSRLLCCCRAMS